MKWWKKLKSLLRRNKSNLQSENRNSHQDDLIEKEIYFPCNAFFRKIIEAVLEQKGISYRDMRLFVIDAEDGAYLRQEEEQYMLQQLYPGLNAYTLCTGRPECHRKEMDYLYKKNELQICIKDVLNGDKLIEIEENEQLDTIDKIKQELERLNLPVDTNDYFIKKAEIELRKIL